MLLFSDVDGTLLDDAGRYAVSRAEMELVSERVRVVLASSQTVGELSGVQRALGLEGAVVAENGAVVAWGWREGMASLGARATIDGREWCVLALGTPAAIVREEVRRAAMRCRIAYVDQRDVAPQIDRRFSVLIRPADGSSAASLAPLVRELRSHGLAVTAGDGWTAVTRNADKGIGARAWLAARTRLGEPSAIVAAVGDGENDEPLLLAAEHRFVIRRDDGTWHPALRALPDVECVPTPGIAGWREVWRQLSALQEV